MDHNVWKKIKKLKKELPFPWNQIVGEEYINRDIAKKKANSRRKNNKRR